jgi:hypothetical protein
MKQNETGKMAYRSRFYPLDSFHYLFIITINFIIFIRSWNGVVLMRKCMCLGRGL